jgi:hypothetical protein
MKPDKIITTLNGHSPTEFSFESFVHYIYDPERSLLVGDLYFYIGFLLLLAFLRVVSTYVYSNQSSKPQNFIYKPTDLHIEVEVAIKENVGAYIPPWWYNKHFGTLGAFGNKLNLKYENEIYEHDDGVQFVVHWYPSRPLAGDLSKVCVFVPGLGSKSTDVRPTPSNAMFYFNTHHILELCSQICAHFT